MLQHLWTPAPRAQAQAHSLCPYPLHPHSLNSVLECAATSTQVAQVAGTHLPRFGLCWRTGDFRLSTFEQTTAPRIHYVARSGPHLS